MMRPRPKFLTLFASMALSGLASNCSVAPCDEFAAPLDRAPGSCPAKATAAVPPPPGEPDPSAPRYCYNTLGQADCYPAPLPGRTNYLGSYARTGSSEPAAGR